MTIDYLEIEEVYDIHGYMIKIGGGRSGIRDFGLLHSAIERAKASFGGNDLYPNIWEKAGAIMQSLVKNHPFEDGNKRTAFFSTKRFIEINGYETEFNNKEIVDFMITVDTNNLAIKEISAWLKKHSKKSQQ